MTAEFNHSYEADIGGLVVQRLIQFARLLRDNGFVTGPEDSQQALQLFSHQPKLLEKRAFRQSLQILFCTRTSELARFDEIFDAYWLSNASLKATIWRDTSLAVQSVVEKNSQGDGLTGAQQGLAHYFEWRNAQNDNEALEEQDKQDANSAKLGGASGQTSRQAADFGKIKDEEEADALLALASRLGKRLHYRLSRRHRRANRGAAIDLRNSMRKALASDGMPLHLARKKRAQPPVKLLIFVDVSDSMDAYSIFFAQFMLALLQETRQTSAFLFNTRLVPVSTRFHKANAKVLTDKLSLLGRDWSGGTRIGEMLSVFNGQYARQLCNKHTICLLMSDGFDAGDRSDLEQQLKQLKRHCKKLIWLNPMLGREDYAPEASGAALLLAQADLALPVHNLHSLATIEKVLIHDV
ncbi:MAG: VWA domain-containing protein [Cohaesibacter sp.]|nr:VWA domain-containing protein [Cohaesibacter sp.]MCV6602267.1 VWA domain-containing protein [Cohaesibacter sp.]